ncbi:deoxyribonuclease II [Ancylostoma caninum]|uniref:Deoxyribonuclease II n=1 Tax=Ancylostoma caninum TaxID=29170 RepID=A0A368FAX0_ANCCA|nr:deoxyribonuclease II [Ancylostoma caninum]
MWTVCLAITALINYGHARLGCKNMQGGDVDWFVAIKLPREADGGWGTSFVYYDPTQEGWMMSPVPIDSYMSAIGATISQIYVADKSRTFTIAYNDGSPVGEAEWGRGHSKGVAAFDAYTGFWMIHSVPKFPPFYWYGYPSTGRRFGQSFMCLSLSTRSLEDVGQYMRFAEVTPLMGNLPPWHIYFAPSLVDVFNRRSLSYYDPASTTLRAIRTLYGKAALVFSKHRKFGADIWYDFIAPYFNTPMAVETWRNGYARDLGTTCGLKPNVYDVNYVNLLGRTFANSQDHSKWGVSMNAAVPAVCVGDVNRQESQFRRGGGAVCMMDPKLWRTFYYSVSEYEECPPFR